MTVKKDTAREETISSYQFKEFANNIQKSGVSGFEIKELKTSKKNKKEFEREIRQEREHAKNNEFSFMPFVRDFRGIKKQEEEDYQKRLANEVNERVAQITENAFQKGFKEGKELGQKEIYGELSKKVDEELKQFLAMVEEVRKTKEVVITQEVNEIYDLIKTLSKWIILRELKEDGDYIKRLLEKLIVELQTQSNILVKVNLDWFKEMPQVLEQIKKSFTGIANTRVEFNHDLGQYGMMVESESSLIDGTIESQFSNLDKLFELVKTHD